MSQCFDLLMKRRRISLPKGEKPGVRGVASRIPRRVAIRKVRHWAYDAGDSTKCKFTVSASPVKSAAWDTSYTTHRIRRPSELRL